MSDGLPLPRLGIWKQSVQLAARRILGQMKPGVLSLVCPRVDLLIQKNPWRLYNEIFLGNCYQPLIALGRRPRILDIGANIGLASLYFLSRWPAARMLIIEPNPAAAQLLKHNLDSDRFPNAEIQLADAALSDSDGEVDFSVPDGNPVAVYARISEGTPSEEPSRKKVRVHTIDAAQLFDQPADLLKLDIEGHEYRVLEHALPKSKVIRSLVIEFHHIEQHQDRLELLLSRLLSRGEYRGVSRTGGAFQSGSFRRQRGCVVLRFAAQNELSASPSSP